LKNYIYTILKGFSLLSIFSSQLLSEARVWNDELVIEAINSNNNKSKSQSFNSNIKKKLSKSNEIDEKSMNEGIDEESIPNSYANRIFLRKMKLNEQYAHINSEKSNVNYVEIKNKRDYDRYMKNNKVLGKVVKNEKNKKIINVVKIKNIKRLEEGLIGVNSINNKNIKIINIVKTRNVHTINNKRKNCKSRKNIHSRNENIQILNNVNHQNSDLSNSTFGVSSQDICK